MDGQYRLARLVSWAFCLALAVIEAWSGRQYTDPDSIAYLDMSDGIVRNNWHTLINLHWSPLYPFLIGVLAKIAHPSARWELPLVHLLNLLIFVCALAAFEFMMRQLIAILVPDGSGPQSELPLLQRAYVWELLGYSVFAWTTFFLAGSVRRVLTDLCVLSFVYLDAGIVLRILSKHRLMLWFVCLGAALGFGYYAKTVLFPVGLLFMVVAVCAAGNWRRSVLPALAMVLIFFVITLPLVTAVSRSAGHLTIGEAGRMEYAWLVYGQPSAFYMSPRLDYRKDPPNVTHPEIAFYGDNMAIVRILHHGPDVLQLAPQSNATYPPWSDPASFGSGLEAPFHFGDQIRTIGKSLKRCAMVLLVPIPLTLAAYLILFFGAARTPGRWRSILRVWPLLVVGIFCLSIYSLILIEPRYIAVFVALVWMSLLCGVQFQRSNDRSRITNIATGSLILSLTATAVGIVIYHFARPPRALQGSISEAYSVASELGKDGLRPGDVIAVVGDGGGSIGFARFARVRIDVAIPYNDSSKFWHISDPREKNEVYDAFREAGARMVVSDEVPPAKGFEDWHRVADTDIYVHNLGQGAHE
jgi:hypothetical protein